MRSLLTMGLTASVLLAASDIAAAQAIGATGYGSFGSVQFAASETFETIAGSSKKVGFGVGGTVLRLWRSVFVDVSFWQYKLDGERVFIDGGTTFSLGIPLDITFRPIDLVAGWRFEGGSVEPYVGGGISFALYTEESEFSVAADNVSESKSGPVVLAGVDVPVGRLVRVGGEFRYRSVTGILGTGGVSQLFDEDQLGGAAFAVRASIGR